MKTKFYSEITDKYYDTQEECAAAEAAVAKNKEQNVEKDGSCEAVNKKSDRKADAKIVEEAFQKQDAVIKECKQRIEEIDKKRSDLYKQKKEDVLNVYKKAKQEEERLNKEFIVEDGKYQQELLDENEKITEAKREAKKALSDFCKKYGSYHCSVDVNGQDILSSLFDVKRAERIFNIFDNFFRL